MIRSGRARVGVDAHPPPRGAAQKLVHRNAERLALDVPEGHVDAAQGAGEDRPAPVEGVTVDRLPVVDDLARVLADQVGLDLLDGRRDRERAPLDDRLAQADDPGIGVHLEEEPARLDQQGLEPGDPQRVAGSDRAPRGPTRSCVWASASVEAPRRRGRRTLRREGFGGWVSS